MISIRERDFSSFFAAPFAAYGNNSPYVSPMKGDLRRFLSLKNPLFETAEDFTYFTAFRNAQPVGRVTAHLHRAALQHHAPTTGYFGFFDCANDDDAATALLGAAEGWARSKGMNRLAGNFNLNAMQQIGVMTDGFDHTPYTDQIWSAPYLPELLTKNGYAARFPMTTFAMRLGQGADSTTLPDARRTELLAEGFSFAPITRRTIAARLEDARHILNRSFVDNPMFVPVSAEEFTFQAKDMKWIMDPRISKVVHFKGEAVGAVIAIPDLNPLLKRMNSRLGLGLPWHYWRYKAKRDRAVVIFQGVLPEFQRRSVNPLMLNEMINDMTNAGYTSVGGTWIADENTASLRQTEKSGATPMHRLHLFEKEL